MKQLGNIFIIVVLMAILLGPLSTCAQGTFLGPSEVGDDAGVAPRSLISLAFFAAFILSALVVTVLLARRLLRLDVEQDPQEAGETPTSSGKRQPFMSRLAPPGRRKPPVPFSAIVAAVSVALLAILLVVVLSPQETSGFGDNMLSLVIVIVVVFGTYRLQPFLFSSGTDGEKPNELEQIAIIAALALTATSFITTVFGIYQFTRPDGGGFGEWMQGVFVSLAVTAGVQLTMLVMAILLGRQLVSSHDISQGQRVNYDVVDEDEKEKPGQIVMRAVPIGLLSGLWIWIWAIAWSNASTAGEPFWTPLNAVLAIAPVILLFSIQAARTAQARRKRVITTTLSIIYAIALSISSLFSFDAFYRFIQTPEQIRIVQSSVVEQLTKDTVSEGLDAITREINIVKERVRTGAPTVQLIRDVAEREGFANDNLDEIRGNLNNIVEENNRLLQDRLDREREQGEALARTSGDKANLENDIQALEVEVENLKKSLEGPQALIAEYTAQLQPLIDKQLAAERRMAEEEAGIGNRAGRGPQFRAAQRERNAALAAQAPVIERKNDQEAIVKTINDKIAEAEEDLAQLRPQLALKEGDLARLRGQTEASSSGVVVDRSTEVATLSRSREALLQVANGGVSQKLDALRLAVTPDNLQSYINDCASFAQIIGRIEGFAVQFGEFSCLPTALEADILKVIELTKLKDEVYTPACINNFGRVDPAQFAPGETAEISASETEDFGSSERVARLLNITRSCLNLIPTTVSQAGDISTRFSVDQSIYSGDNYDLRRSIRDVERNDAFAWGAVGLALFVDLMILFVGIVMALSSTNRAAEDIDNPNPKLLQRRIYAKLAASLPDLPQFEDERYLADAILSACVAMSKTNVKRGFSHRLEIDLSDEELANAMKAVAMLGIPSYSRHATASKENHDAFDLQHSMVERLRGIAYGDAAEEQRVADPGSKPVRRASPYDLALDRFDTMMDIEIQNDAPIETNSETRRHAPVNKQNRKKPKSRDIV